MRTIGRLFHVIVILLGGAGAGFASQGTITGLTLSPAGAEAGTAITATATGSADPCGAVHIDWGDGTAITYATERLPVRQTHVYKTAGTFGLRAQGMGNCTGEARARIVITAPPPPPPPPPSPRPAPAAPRLTDLSVAVPEGAAPSVRALTIRGSGRCSYTLDFGDGNSVTREGTMPDVVQHNYPADGRYTAVVTANPPCTGVHRSIFTVTRPATAREAPASISRVDVRPQLARVGQRIVLTIAGSGTCRFVVDFGDGQSRTFTERLPHRAEYRYARAGDYEIRVSTPERSCNGGGDAVLRIQRR